MHSGNLTATRSRVLGARLIAASDCRTHPVRRHGSCAICGHKAARRSLLQCSAPPQDSGEHNLMLTLARLFCLDETRRLLVLVRRAVRAAGHD